MNVHGIRVKIPSKPFWDYDLMIKNFKFIVGYSDATALQMGIYKKTNIPSLMGFNCSDIKNGKVADITEDVIDF